MFRTTSATALLLLIASGCASGFGTKFADSAAPGFAVENDVALAASRQAEKADAGNGTLVSMGRFRDRSNDAPGEPPQTGRLIIYSGEFTVLVASVETARKSFLTAVEELGGYLEAQEDGTVTCRVPAAKFSAAVELLPGLGRVIRRSIEALDVTREFRDLEVRVANARKSLERLQELLTRAEKVEDVLKIEKEMRRLTEELELHEARLRTLASLIALSKIRVEFRSNAPAPIDVPMRRKSPFPWINRTGVEHVLEDF